MSAEGPPIFSTVTVAEVSFTGETGPVQAEAIPSFAYGPGLDPDNFSTGGENPTDAFVVALHAVDPPKGSGNPEQQDSIIGFKILETGEYEDIEVPVFPYELLEGVFPPNPTGDTTIVGTLWHDIGVDYGATQGVITSGEEATITGLDQNDDLDPIESVPTVDGDEETV
jgi:hypothetical protein